jgi:hypothetical protein
MTSLYPVPCNKCNTIIGYSDIDFTNVDERYTAVWCKYCVEIQVKK